MFGYQAVIRILGGVLEYKSTRVGGYYIFRC